MQRKRLDELRYNRNAVESLVDGDAIAVYRGRVIPLYLAHDDDESFEYNLSVVKQMCGTYTGLARHFFNDDGSLKDILRGGRKHAAMRDMLYHFSDIPKVVFGVIEGDNLDIENDSFDVLHSKEFSDLMKTGCLDRFETVTIDGKEYLVSEIKSSVDVTPYGKIAATVYHGTCGKFVREILFKGLRKVKENSMFSNADGSDFVFLTTSFQVAERFAKDAARKFKSRPVVVEIDGERLDTDKVVLDYDIAMSHSGDDGNSPYDISQRRDGDKVSAVARNDARNGSRYSRFGYDGVVNPTAIESCHIWSGRSWNTVTPQELKANHELAEARLIYEDPDNVEGTDVSYEDPDAYAVIVNDSFSEVWIGDCGSTHIDMIETDYDVPEDSNRRNSWHGRIWTGKKLMSFWRVPTPEQARKLVDIMNKKIGASYFGDPSLDYYDYRLDTLDRKKPVLRDYIDDKAGKPDIERFKKVLASKNIDFDDFIKDFDDFEKRCAAAKEQDAGRFDLDKIHLMKGDEKSRTAQMMAYLQARLRNKGEKLGVPNNSREVPQAEYNHYRRYGMGESRVNESPNVIDVNDGICIGHYRWDSDDAIAFIANEGLTEIYFGEFSHSSIVYDVIYDGDEDAADSDPAADDWFSRKRSFQGRIWTEPKIISVWRQPTPSQLQQIVRLFEENKDIFVTPVDLMEYRIEVSESQFVNVADYIKGNTQGDNDFDKTAIHLKQGEDKSSDPRMQAYIRGRERNQAERMTNDDGKETSRAEYNHYRRYGMGESKNGVNEMKSEDISLNSFKTKDTLHPKFWVNDKLNSNVRLRLLDIAYDFWEEMGADWVKPADIVLTGSIANYNWSRYSDVDVHILVDFSKVYDKRQEFVENYFKAQKEQWEAAHPSLKIYGFDVEIYVEDVNTDNPSTGIYSLEKNKWVVEPDDFQDVVINQEYVKRKSAQFMTQIDQICSKLTKAKSEKQYETLGKKMYSLFRKMKTLRKEGLDSKGELSSGNIIWKVCRRMGYIEKMWDVLNKTYDRIYSIRESRAKGSNLLFEGLFNHDTRGWLNIGVIKGYCAYASGDDSYLMADPNAPKTENMADFRYRHMAYSSKPEGMSTSYDVPNYYQQNLVIYPEYADTYYGECILGKGKGSDQKKKDREDFLSRLFIIGNDVVLHHDSPVKITDGRVGGSHPKQSYSKDSDIGTYFWGSRNSGSDQSNIGRYTYWCRVPKDTVYDFMHNPDRLTLTQAMSKYGYAGQEWNHRNNPAIVVTSWRNTPIWFILDKHNGRYYDKDWNEIEKPI